jgi:hypothetical protein
MPSLTRSGCRESDERTECSCPLIWSNCDERKRPRGYQGGRVKDTQCNGLEGLLARVSDCGDPAYIKPERIRRLTKPRMTVRLLTVIVALAGLATEAGLIGWRAWSYSKRADDHSASWLCYEYSASSNLPQPFLMPLFSPCLQPAGAARQGLRIRLADIRPVSLAVHEDNKNDCVCLHMQIQNAKWPALPSSRTFATPSNFPEAARSCDLVALAWSCEDLGWCQHRRRQTFPANR